MVDENWVCQHRLLQFIFGRLCHVWCSDLCKLFMNGKFTKHFHFLCAQIDLLFIIFVCSLYSPWTTVRLLHHFGFYVLIWGYAVCIFLCHWCKIYNVLRWLMQISERQCDPCFCSPCWKIIRETTDSTVSACTTVTSNKRFTTNCVQTVSLSLQHWCHQFATD